jgi:hypothetical protein
MGTLHEDLCTFLKISHSGLFQTKTMAKITIYILCSVTFFQKLCCLRDNLEKYARAIQATSDNMAHAQCVVDN